MVAGEVLVEDRGGGEGSEEAVEGQGCIVEGEEVVSREVNLKRGVVIRGIRTRCVGLRAWR